MLARYDGPERFDVLPLLVATDGDVAAFGRDVRRLRPNIVIDGVDGIDEFGWPGADRVHAIDSSEVACHLHRERAASRNLCPLIEHGTARQSRPLGGSRTRSRHRSPTSSATSEAALDEK